MADAPTRTEPATPARREAARRDGAIVVSPEIAPVAVLCLVLGIGTWGAPVLVHRTGAMLVEWLAAAGPIAAGDGPLGPLGWRTAASLAGALAPFFLAVALVGIGAVVAQTGFRLRPALAAPDPARITFAAGWKRLVSVDGVATLAKALAKIALVLGVGWRVLGSVGGGALDASALPVEGTLALAGSGLRELGVAVAAVLVVVAGADHAWARWRHERRLMMSRHELREEQREREGDPRVRGRFRRAHRDVARHRMLAEVVRADVVVADPARVAVALRYRADESSAARVLAKGAGELAGRITDAARAGGVPIVERRTLAATLDRTVPLGSDIPQPLYRAVAEVLAHVHASRGGRAVEGMPGEGA
jgi:flagellar biosynthetic protein FlhB